MNKRLIHIVGGMTALLFLTFIIILVYDNYLHKEEDLRRPSDIGSYSDMDYYNIDPATVLTSLESEDTDVFSPLLQNPNEIEEVTDLSIRWTQADFLKIAGALGQFVWGDPMDFKDWSVYYISFEGSCNDPIGFDYASITYFKTGRKTYTTRLIEIGPYYGWVRWGGGKTYPKPILQKWNNVDLLGAEITADDAVRIAREDARERFQVNNNCGVLISSPQNDDSKNWHLKIFPGSLNYITYIVNFDTGSYTFQKPNK
jgi:hypothetical protein